MIREKDGAAVRRLRVFLLSNGRSAVRSAAHGLLIADRRFLAQAGWSPSWGKPAREEFPAGEQKNLLRFLRFFS